jgi:hypothetical protein
MRSIAILVALAGAAAALAVWSSGASAREGGMAATPFTFYLTHYVLLGSDPNNPTGVRYENSGRPSAKAANGSTITLTGKGGWNPAEGSASGGGTYTVTNKTGAVTARGTWRATKFASFLQLPGWWGIQDFKEAGWQGPPGSASYSGFLTLNVEVSGLGKGVLKLWCLMPGVPKPAGHVSDGLSLTGPKLRFTDFREQEKSMEGVMLYGS